MSKFRIIHVEKEGVFHIGVCDAAGKGVSVMLYPSSPHYVVEQYEDYNSHVWHSFVRMHGTPNTGSGLNHPEMSYDLWRDSVNATGLTEADLYALELTEAHLYALWLIGQPPEAVTPDVD